MVDLWLKDTKIVPENMLVSIGIKDGKIAAIKKIAPKREESINLREFVILPGLIDPHAHFRDPGLTYKEDFRTGTMAAAAGGFTTIFDMPNTKPPTNTAKAFKDKLKIARHKSLVDYGLHAGVGKIKDIKNLFMLKPVSFKLYMDLLEDTTIDEIFKEIGKIDGEFREKKGYQKPLISLHCEDKATVTSSTEKLMKKGRDHPEKYADARPPLAETIAISKALKLADKYKLAVHICHVSTKESVELINETKKAGTKVTSEVTPHHLLLDSKYLRKCGNLAKTNPPLRDHEHKLTMDCLDDVDVVGTDHAPHTISEKEDTVWNAPPGIPNLDTTLPLLLTQINNRNMTFTDLKRLLCENPARIFHLESKGFIKMGMDADFVVVDRKKEGVINPDKFKSKAKYSPFKGFKIKGMPVMTMARGKIIMEDDYLSKNQGKFIYS